MLEWLFGAEDSFSKALVYNLLTFSVLSLFGALVYCVSVIIPVAANNYANK